MFHINHSAKTSLIQQVVDHIKKLIEQEHLSPGMKIPSIRAFADSHNISMSTVIEAYDRLVAEGYLVPRQNKGFFVRSFDAARYIEEKTGSDVMRFDDLWVLSRIWEHNSAEGLIPGCGWLPDEWMSDDLVRKSLRTLSTQKSLNLGAYGQPKGHLPLRWKISDILNEQEIYCPPEQVLMTNGAAHALGLIINLTLKNGDTVLVDDPGYSLLPQLLKRLKVKVIGVPWTTQGPDIELLNNLVLEHKPKIFFTNPRFHNPTGATYSPATAHKVLQLADKHDFLIVEDDVCADLDSDKRRTMASMDQLERVIYISSYSKTLSPGLRVGYIAGHADLIEDLAQFKMMFGLTTSDLSERMVYNMLNEGHYRKHIKLMQENLIQAHHTTRKYLLDSGFDIFTPDGLGIFLWAKHPNYSNALDLSNEALKENIHFAPSHLFSSRRENMPWLRFNVGFSTNKKMYDFLQRITQ